MGFQVTTMQQNNDESEHNTNYQSNLSKVMQLDLGTDRIFSYQKKTPDGTSIMTEVFFLLEFIANKLYSFDRKLMKLIYKWIQIEK